MRRRPVAEGSGESGPSGATRGPAYQRRLHLILATYTAGVVVFLLGLGWAEQHGLSRHWIGPALRNAR